MSHDLPYYEREGVRYPRLTRILSILREPEVETWRERIGEKAAARRQQQTQQRGNLLHQMIAKTLLSGQEAKLPKGATFEVRMCWQAWQRWYRLNQSKLAVQGIETPCISSTLGYGATLDLWEPSIVTDWKTGSRIQAKHWIQVHAEVPLIYGANNLLLEGRNIRVRIVRLDPAVGDFEEQIRLFDPDIVDTFLKLKDVYMAWYSGDLQPQEVQHGRHR